MIDTRKFTTDEEWITHALNIHGTFLERKCEQIIANTSGYQIFSTNYPVAFPPPHIDNIRSKESNLDIWAGVPVRQTTRLNLAIECKKNNPDYTEWIFFRDSKNHFGEFTTSIIEYDFSGENLHKYKKANFYFENFVFADEGRETKSDYLKLKNNKDKTKTANNSISDASHQVSIAKQSLVYQSMNIVQKNNSHTNCIEDVFFPIIITTANLFTCDFDVANIDVKSGEIDLNKIELIEHPYLFYNYPLPTHLHNFYNYSKEDLARIYEHYIRSNILIVNTESLHDLLDKLPKMFLDRF